MNIRTSLFRQLFSYNLCRRYYFCGFSYQSQCIPRNIYPGGILHKKTNLLFFGNFHSMQIDDYDWAMKEMMADKDYLYRSIIKDIYYLGVVLAKKYKYLRVSYNIFMFGLVVAMFAFGIMLAYDSFRTPPHPCR